MHIRMNVSNGQVIGKPDVVIKISIKNHIYSQVSFLRCFDLRGFHLRSFFTRVF